MNKRTTTIAAAGLGIALALTACSNDNSDSDSASPTASSMWTTPEAPQLDLSRYGTLPAVPAGTPTVDCSYPAAEPAAKPVQAPNATGVPAEGTVTVDLTTNAGTIGIDLDRAAAPCSVASFVSLAQQGFFDGTPCHRLSTNPGLQMLQCGDPSGSGTGGPGYRFANEYPTTAYTAGDPALQQPVVYPRGTVAMAHSAAPDSNGSQFFLVYADSVLPPDYTVFGTMTDDGIATVEKIAAAGDDGSSPAGGGAPNTAVTVQTATVG
ncbi:peptidylprolyl isomerase [Prescottella sp. R16]|uniref:peptidylprolyl isomerase n=1 Tax=Prescottella sp. R16 TaxID=3064529 RepID=UPI00272DF282|nr:peptidylprolyl isomerase [Prescottella sp. R16]